MESMRVLWSRGGCCGVEDGVVESRGALWR